MSRAFLSKTNGKSIFNAASHDESDVRNFRGKTKQRYHRENIGR